MSEFLAAAVAAVGAPEEMVVRSATARATAQGVSVDDILAQWGGGAAAPAAVAAAPTEAPAPAAPADAEPTPPAETPTAPVVEAPVAAQELAPVAIAVMEEEEESEVAEPAALRDRILVPGRLGAILGAMFGVLLSVIAAPYVLEHVRLVGEDESLRTVIEVTGGSLTAWLAVVSAVIGALIGRLSGVVPSWIDKGLSVKTSQTALTVVGAATGAALGVVGSGVMLALGETIENFEEGVADIVQIGALDAFVTLIVGGAILGGITAIIAQLSSLPEGLTAAEKDESELIKHRLVTSYLMPAALVLLIVVVVVLFGSVLVAFHTQAWVLAIVAASGILGFASLSASRPTMKITKGEFMVAAAAVIVVLVFILMLSGAFTADHSEEATRVLRSL